MTASTLTEENAHEQTSRKSDDHSRYAVGYSLIRSEFVHQFHEPNLPDCELALHLLTWNAIAYNCRLDREIPQGDGRRQFANADKVLHAVFDRRIGYRAWILLIMGKIIKCLYN